MIEKDIEMSFNKVYVDVDCLYLKTDTGYLEYSISDLIDSCRPVD